MEECWWVGCGGGVWLVGCGCLVMSVEGWCVVLFVWGWGLGSWGLGLLVCVDCVCVGGWGLGVCGWVWVGLGGCGGGVGRVCEGGVRVCV